MAVCATAVLGASTGGIEALRAVLSALPVDLTATVLVVVHIPETPSALPSTLGRDSKLPVSFAGDGDLLVPGRVFVAPPGRHLLVYDEVLRVVRGPRENGFIPAIDPLFRSAAHSGEASVIGAVLSGALDDGAAGIREIKQRGGTTVAQDPKEALFPDMPEAAIETGSVDHVLSAREIGRLIGRFANDTAAAGPGAGEGRVTQHSEREQLTPTDLTCPDCGGTLRESRAGAPPHLACHVGHTYTNDTLLASQDQSLDRALWSAIRTLRESAMLRRKMAQRARQGGLAALAEAFESQAEHSEARADAIRNVVTVD
jgi:two-component system chemotaxis response regulator CheB